MPPKAGKKAGAKAEAKAEATTPAVAAAAAAAPTPAVAAVAAAAPTVAAVAPVAVAAVEAKAATPTPTPAAAGAATAPVAAATATATATEEKKVEKKAAGAAAVSASIAATVDVDDLTAEDGKEEKVVVEAKEPEGPSAAALAVAEATRKAATLVKQTDKAKLAEAEKLKTSGGKLFTANDFKGAALKFTEAIALDPTNELLYSNRSAAYLSLSKSDHKMIESSIIDGRICVELKPEWGKGYARLGAALFAAREYGDAAAIYALGVAKEPTNQILTDGLANAQKYLKMKREADAEDEKRGHVIGIDLGTTFSCVGVWLGDKVVMVPNDRGEITTPSYVAFTTEGKRLVGMAAKSQAAKNPRNTIYDVKRFIGQRYSDAGVSTDCDHYAFPVRAAEDDKPMIGVDMGMHGQKSFAAEEISAMVLAYLKKSAETFLKQPITKAVITVPAYFNDAQRNATKAAGRIAGLDVMRIINEPTAAALSYGLDLKTQGKGRKVNVLIFDLGGGTFDVSLLTIENGVFEVKATGGDTRLGGEDFDLTVMRAMMREAESQGIPDFSGDQRAIKRLTVACEQAKRTLSTAASAEIVVDSIYVPKKTEVKEGKAEGKTLRDSYDFRYTLERSKFESLCSAFFVRCLETVKKVLKDAKAKPESVDDIVLVGGSTRIPKVQEMLQAFFSGKELCRSLNPDEAVAYGAAVQGAILNGKRTKQTDNLLLMDVTPLSLGIETEGRVMSVIIPRNTSIPCVKTQTYTTTENYQTQVDVSVYEGERMKSDANNLLGKFTITGIERAKKGEAKVDVSFALDSNGILNVEAKDQKTGASAKIEIANRGRSSDEDIERMVRDAERFRREDESRLKKVEAVNELEGLINQIHDLILEDPTLGAAVETAAAEAQAWLEENGDEASAADVNAKRRSLSTILAREQTRGSRPGGRKR